MSQSTLLDAVAGSFDLFSCALFQPAAWFTYPNRQQCPVQHEGKLLDFNPFRHALLVLLHITLSKFIHSSTIPKPVYVPGMALSAWYGRATRLLLFQTLFHSWSQTSTKKIMTTPGAANANSAHPGKYGDGRKNR